MSKKKISIAEFDPELSDALKKETVRQEEHIELIASENYASTIVMEAQGSILTNKYAEGYPHKRYYGGCEHVDTIEQLAIDRAKKLFNAGYANVQPHSGSQANAAVYMALLKPGDTILGMSLSHGGHLTHGASVSFSGRIYNAIQYGLKSNGYLDYDQVLDLAKKYQPKLLIGGFSAYSRIVDWKIMKDIANKVDAYFLVDMAHISGLVAANLYPSPIGIADVITSTTHKTLRGPRGGLILANNDEELNKKLNFSVFPESQGGPLCHAIAAKAICFKEAMSESFITYQKQVIKNAQVMTKKLQSNGFNIVSGGTDDHLFLLNLIGKEYTGKDAEQALGRANITVNKNTVPNDPRSPFITSGLRIGTPAITTRGFTEKESIELANWITEILNNINDKKIELKIKEKVVNLCKSLPVH